MATQQAIGLELSKVDGSIILTRELMEQYEEDLRESGCRRETVSAYTRSLEKLYLFLPEEKTITREALHLWKETLKQSGCSDSTINLRLSAVNSLLKFCGMKKAYMSHTAVAKSADLPELTRDEYLRFLHFLRGTHSEQEYLLVKIFALVDLHLRELQYVTVEAVSEQVIRMGDGRTAMVPASLQKELLAYARRNQLEQGPLFVTKSGKLIDRSNITHSFQQLAKDSGIPAGKCCPSALHRLYCRTQEEIRSQLEHLYVRAYDNLLEAEQTLIGWE